MVTETKPKLSLTHVTNHLLHKKRLVEADDLAAPGQGFYDYNQGAVYPKPNTDHALGTKIVNRITAMLINEAIDALFLNIVSQRH